MDYLPKNHFHKRRYKEVIRLIFFHRPVVNRVNMNKMFLLKNDTALIPQFKIKIFI